jgi:hypothetical protein
MKKERIHSIGREFDTLSPAKWIQAAKVGDIWKIVSIASWSRKSALKNLILDESQLVSSCTLAKLFSDEFTKLSITVTSKPASSRQTMVWDPMYPGGEYQEDERN